MNSTIILALEALSPLQDPPTRAVLVMSLLAFFVLGLGLIVGVMLGGHWVRRISGESLTKPLPLRRSNNDDTKTRPASKSTASPHWNPKLTAVESGVSDTLPG